MPVAFTENISPDTAFSLWKIEENAAELYGHLQLKNHEKAYLETLNNGKRNLHWLSTRVLLRKMLNTREYIDCRIDEHGKPYLPHIPVHISLSHSRDYAAVMTSRSEPVGIDIEVIENKIERIARKFLSEDELPAVGPDRIAHLYVCWCAKEAIYKLYGKKSVSFLENIRLHPFEYREEGSFDADLALPGKTTTFKIHYRRYEDYMIGYTSGKANGAE